MKPALALTAVTVAALTTLAPLAAADASPAASHATKAFKLSDVKHVFLIVLENKNYSTTFGDPSAMPYLATTLRKQGLLMEDYYGTGHESNDNYISMTSGQAPNSSNQTDCQSFVNFKSTSTESGEPDQQSGDGCVYPTSIGNIGSQLSKKKISWKGYMQDMGNVKSREAVACGHPAVGAKDNTQDAVKGDAYVSRHDPFVYFHSIINNKKFCDSHVVALGSSTGKMPKGSLKGETGLATDLKKLNTTKAYNFITPNLCYDGHDYPCTNQKSGASAVADIDSFLGTWVPKIEKSAAFKKNGLIDITFDESDGPQSDSSACCGESLDTNAATGLAGLAGMGGGKIGSLLISPFIKPGTSTTTAYNHYSMLATDEAIFGLPKLGYATKATTFSTKLFRLPAKAIKPAPALTAAEKKAGASGDSTSSTSRDLGFAGFGAVVFLAAGACTTLRRKHRRTLGS